MKELSIKDKANRYDKAIEIAKSKIKNDKDHVLYEDDVMEIFPELKVSDDERIRKSLIELFHDTVSNDEIFSDYGLDKTEVLAWLEKQGEQKPVEWCSEDEQNLNVCLSYIPHEFLRRWLKDIIHIKYDKPIDRVEPKFKAGDWVILAAGELSTTLQIANVDINKKLYWFNDGSYLPIVDEECLHLWTIQDAKEGDVLVASDGSIFIYKNQRDNGVVHYVAVTPCNDLVINENDYSWERKNACHPATKDEQTILFARMKEEGYEWDEDKKELKKL